MTWTTSHFMDDDMDDYYMLWILYNIMIIYMIYIYIIHIYVYDDIYDNYII